MKHAFARTLIAIFLVPVLSGAVAELTGKWTGLTANGFEVTLDLTATETTLTGTLTRGEDTIPLAGGKVTKNTFTFSATLNEQTETFTGELNGDAIKVWLDRQGPEMAAALKRVKK
jgi:hypothetical protein